MRFTMIGKLSIGKETEKFKPYEEKTYASGYKKKQLKFSAKCGDDLHYLTLEGGITKDNLIYTMTKGKTNDKGETEKGEFISVPFSDRFDPDILSKVADFRKYILDLDYRDRRDTLKNMLDRQKNEGIQPSEETLKKIGLTSSSDIKKEYEKSCSKRYEFISPLDMIDTLRKVIGSPEYKNAKFMIQGSGEYSYYNGKVYRNYVPTRIYLAKDDEKEMSQGNLTLYFNRKSLKECDDRSIIDGYIMEYDAGLKQRIPISTTVVVRKGDPNDPKSESLYERIISKFKAKGVKWYEYGMIVNMIDGAQRKEITEDMLTEEQKEDIECGLITLEDIASELNEKAYGDKITEYRFFKPAKGYTSGKKETEYEDENFIIKVSSDKENGFDDDIDDEDDEI